MHVICIHSIPLLLMYSQFTTVEESNFNHNHHQNEMIDDEQDGLEDLELKQSNLKSESMPESLEVIDDSMTIQSPIDGMEENEMEDSCAADKKIIESLLQKYKAYKTPAQEGVTVWIEVWVQEVNAINEMTSDFDMDIYMTELWIDKALRYGDMNPCRYNLSFGDEILHEIWKPNTVFINSKSASIHKSPFTNVFLMIYSNGTVWVNYRVQVKGPCQMDFTSFPMDEQTCLLTFESFSYNNQQVDMRWIDTKEPLILLKDQITLPDFVLTNYSTSVALVNYPAGDWNELTMTFTFTRRYGWYIFQAYVPTYLTIFISWISFCLSAKMIPARTMLGVNSLLALTFHFGNIMRNLPRVSYVKAFDVWMLSCLSFVFCSLLELAIIGSINERNEAIPVKKSFDRRSRSSSPIIHYKEIDYKIIKRSMSHIDPWMTKKVLVPFDNRITTDDGITVRDAISSNQNDALYRKHSSYSRNGLDKTTIWFHKYTNCWTADRIDRLSIILFPSLFTIFNIIYWSYYLTRRR